VKSTGSAGIDNEDDLVLEGGVASVEPAAGVLLVGGDQDDAVAGLEVVAVIGQSAGHRGGRRGLCGGRGV
jgi:hypothetical protein